MMKFFLVFSPQMQESSAAKFRPVTCRTLLQVVVVVNDR